MAAAARPAGRPAADLSATGLSPAGCAPPPSQQTHAHPTCQVAQQMLGLHALSYAAASPALTQMCVLHSKLCARSFHSIMSHDTCSCTNCQIVS